MITKLRVPRQSNPLLDEFLRVEVDFNRAVDSIRPEVRRIALVIWEFFKGSRQEIFFDLRVRFRDESTRDYFPISMHSDCRGVWHKYDYGIPYLFFVLSNEEILEYLRIERSTGLKARISERDNAVCAPSQEYDRETDPDEKENIARPIKETIANAPLEPPVMTIDDWAKIVEMEQKHSGMTRKPEHNY